MNNNFPDTIFVATNFNDEYLAGTTALNENKSSQLAGKAGYNDYEIVELGLDFYLHLVEEYPEYAL